MSTLYFLSWQFAIVVRKLINHYAVTQKDYKPIILVSYN